MSCARWGCNRDEVATLQIAPPLSPSMRHHFCFWSLRFHWCSPGKPNLLHLLTGGVISKHVKQTALYQMRLCKQAWKIRENGAIGRTRERWSLPTVKVLIPENINAVPTLSR